MCILRLLKTHLVREINRFKNETPRDFCVKLSNLTRDIRFKDLKTELRKRECNPLAITWKGHFRKCFLHFGNHNGGPNTQEDERCSSSASNAGEEAGDNNANANSSPVNGATAAGGEASGASRVESVDTTTVKFDP
ncbi:hypothetical protein ACLKA6_010341 [Drosophila palustris]